jgi:hypothetical protein
VSAPVLSPAEQEEVTRFGVHDDDVIADLESHLDDEPRCEAPKACDRPASGRFVVECACRKARIGCDEHLAATAKWFDDHPVSRCLACETRVLGYQVVSL